MSNTVDNRVVEMQFKNEDFERGVKQTITSLDNLKKALEINTNSLDLSRLQREVDGINLANITTAVEALSNRFSAFGIVGMSVIHRITNGVIDLAEKMGQATFGQIFTGGKNRAQKVANARFQLEGLFSKYLDSAERVESAFNSARDAVDGTAYGLDAAVSTASQLAASNVELGDDMDKALKGVAGLAAMTNTDFEYMGQIFATVAGNGRLMGMQLSQIASHGVNAAAVLGDALGKTEGEIREMTSKGEIDFKTFASAMSDAFGDQAAKADKTFIGVLTNIRAQLSRIGEIFAAGIIENDDLIAFLGEVKSAIKAVKAVIDPLAEPFKKLISSVAHLGSSLLRLIGKSGVKDEATNFVDYLVEMFEKLTNFIDNITKRVNGFTETLHLDKAAKEVKDTVDGIVKATDKVKEIANTIWFGKNIYGNGQARKNALGNMYDQVQGYVNAMKEANFDMAKADEIYSKTAKNETEKVIDAKDKERQAREKAIQLQEEQNQKNKNEEEKTSNFAKVFSALVKIFESGKKVLISIGEAFKETFISGNKNIVSKLVNDFTKFVDKLAVTDKGAKSIKNTFKGLFGVIDILIRLFYNAAKVILPVIVTLSKGVIKITGFIGKYIGKFNKLLKSHKIFSKISEGILNLFGKLKEYFNAFVESIKNNTVFSDFIDTIKDIIETIYKKVVPAAKETSDSVKDVTGSFKKVDTTWIKKAVDKIADVFSFLNKKLIKYKDKIVNSITGIINVFKGLKKPKETTKELSDETEKANEAATTDATAQVKKAATPITSIFDLAKKVLEKAKEYFSEFVDFVIEKIKSLTPEQTAILGVSSALIVFLLSLRSISKSASKFIRSFGRIGDSIANTIDAIKSNIDELRKDKKKAYGLAVLHEVAVILGIIGISMIMLTKVDTGKLIITASVLAALTAVIVLLANSVANFGTKIEDWSKQMMAAEHIKVMGKFLLQFAAMIFVLSLSLKAISKIDTKDIWLKLGVFTVLLAEMFGVVIGMSKLVKEFPKVTGALVGLSVAILLIATSLAVLSVLDSTSVILSATAIAIALVGLGGALALAGINAEKIKVLPLIILISSIGIIVAAIIALTFIQKEGKNVIAAAAAIAIILFSLVKAFAAIRTLSGETQKLDKKQTLTALGSLSTLSSAVLMLAMAVTNLAGIKSYKKLGVALASVIVLLYVVTELFKQIMTLPKIPKGMATSLLMMLLMCQVVISGLNKLSQNGSSWQNMAVAAVSLAGVLYAIVGVMAILNKMDDKSTVGKAISIMLISLALIPMADALAKLSKYNWKQLLAAAGAIFAVVATITLALAGLSALASSGVGIGAILIAMAALVVVLLAVSASMATLSKAIKVIASSIKLLSKIDYDAIDTGKLNELVVIIFKLSAISLLASVGVAALGGGMIILGLGVAAITLSLSVLLKSATLFLDSLRKFIQFVIEVSDSSEKLSNGIKVVGNSLVNLIKNVAKSLATGLIIFIQALQTNSVLIGNALTSLILTILDILIKSKIKIAEKIIEGLTSLFEMLNEKLPPLFEQVNNLIIKLMTSIAENARIYGYLGSVIAIEFTMGIMKGLGDSAEDLVDTAVWLTLKIINAIRVTFDKYKDLLANGLKSIFYRGSSGFWKYMKVWQDVNNPLGKLLGHEDLFDGFAKDCSEEADYQLELFDAEYERMSKEHSTKNGNTFQKSQEEAAKNVNMSGVKDTYALKMREAASNPEAAKSAANDNIAAYGTGLNTGLSNTKDWLTEQITEITGGAFSAGSTKAQPEMEIIARKSAEGISEYTVRELQRQGYKLNEAGTEWIKEVPKGMEEGASDASKSNWDIMSFLTGKDGILGSLPGETTEIADESGGNFTGTLLSKLTDPEMVEKLGDASASLGGTIKDKFNESLKINSPSREAMKSTGYWLEGLLIPLESSKSNKALYDASAKNAEAVKNSFTESIKNVPEFGNNLTYTPTIKPVLDSSNMGQYGGLMDVINNPATVQLAADSQLSIRDANQFKLAQQMEQLNSNISKMANQDLSKVMDGVAINVNADTTVDGTVLRKTASRYTINQINEQEQAILMAKGARA